MPGPFALPEKKIECIAMAGNITNNVDQKYAIICPRLNEKSNICRLDNKNRTPNTIRIKPSNRPPLFLIKVPPIKPCNFNAGLLA
jgi:hypothetical protein